MGGGVISMRKASAASSASVVQSLPQTASRPFGSPLIQMISGGEGGGQLTADSCGFFLNRSSDLMFTGGS